MAKKAKKIKTGKGLKLEIVNPHAAGIDVSSTEMQVCVPEKCDSDNNRRFGTFTAIQREKKFQYKYLKIKQIKNLEE
ncbi:MAG: hypothetical protein LBC80_06270 [Treponema sp.]|jgi:hypothetical protein|nr:hypothetical protein [Treponema sp.]